MLKENTGARTSDAPARTKHAPESLCGGEDPERARARKYITVFEQRFSISIHAHVLFIRVTARTRCTERE